MTWTPYDWLNKFYTAVIAMATLVVIVNGHGLGTGMHRSH